MTKLVSRIFPDKEVTRALVLRLVVFIEIDRFRS